MATPSAVVSQVTGERILQLASRTSENNTSSAFWSQRTTQTGAAHGIARSSPPGWSSRLPGCCASWPMTKPLGPWMSQVG